MNTLPLGQRQIIEEVYLLIRRKERGWLKSLHPVFAPLLFNGGEVVHFKPDPSGVALPLFFDVPLLLPISGPPLSILLSRQLLLLFLLDALVILAPPVDRDDSQCKGTLSEAPVTLQYDKAGVLS